jgi:hypothetical protein
MDVDPLSIFFSIIRIAAAILLVIFFFIMWNSFSLQIKSDDIHQTNIELFENIASSGLASYKYILSPEKLDQINGKGEQDFLRTCQYLYHIYVEDPASGSIWEFGNDTKYQYEPYYYGSNIVEYYSGIERKDNVRNENYYGNSNITKVKIKLHDTLIGRMSCMVEKSYRLKKIQNTTMSKCMDYPCISLRRDGNRVCIFTLNAVNTQENIDCKNLPADVQFEEFYEDVPSLLAQGVDFQKPIEITAYPIKDFITPASCESIRNNIPDYVAGETDGVKVYLCASNPE